MSDYSYSIRTDPKRNVVHLSQAGHAERADLVRMKAEYARALAQVRPGFVLVHDQRAVRSFSDEALEVGRELVALTNEHGASKVIRIAPEALLSRTRVSRVLMSAQSRYRDVRVSSPEEAERLLQEHLDAARAPKPA